MPKECQITFEDNISAGKFDFVIEFLLVSLLAFMPLAFGVVHAWSEQVVVILSSMIVICFLLKLFLYNNQCIIWSWVYVPLCAFLILVVIQLISLPAWLVNIISPNTLALRKELLSDLGNTDEILKSIPLSFYPHAAKHDLRLILAVAGAFVVALNVFRRPEQIKRLLRAITIIGAVIAVITLAQNLFGNGKIYWLILNRYSKSYSGPFVNHSNYGQFMNLSIGAALGLIMVKLHEVFGNRKVTLPNVLEYFSSTSAISLWLLIAMVGVSTATVFISLTRGGMIGMLVAMGITTLFISSKQRLRSHGWIMVVIAIISFTCILYIGFDAVYNRLATLRDLNEAGKARLQMLKDTTAAWSKYPLLGTGLGTYSIVYPMFDHSKMAVPATHAENEYAQTAEETGLIGLVLLIVFAAIIWFHFFRNTRRTNHPIFSVAYGLGFGLLAILLQSFSDFGQHLPANAFLSAIFCALLIAVARYGQTDKLITIKAAFWKNKLTKTIIFLCVSGIYIWAFSGANNSRLAEVHRNKVHTLEKRLAKTNWQGTEATYADLLSNASAVLAYEPENVKNLYLLNVYRWRSINQTENPDISNIHTSEDSIPVVRDIVEQLHKANILCPTYGPAYTLAGQIEKFILNDDSGADRIRKGFLLAPCNPIVCFTAGYLDFAEGKYEDCTAKFEKAVQLDERLFKDVVSIYVNDLSRPYLALSLAGNNITRLNHVTNVFREAQYHDLVQQSREKTQKLLQDICSQPETPTWALINLAGIYKEQENTEAAIECYCRALTLDYNKILWRIELAKLLAEKKRMPEAMRQARICLRIRPNSKEAEKLVADFSMFPATWNNDTVER